MKLSIVGKAMAPVIQGLNGEAVSTGGAEIGTEESLWHSNIAEEPHPHSSTHTPNFPIRRRVCHTRLSPTDAPYYFQFADESSPLIQKHPYATLYGLIFIENQDRKTGGIKLYLDFPMIGPILCVEFKLQNRKKFLRRLYKDE